MHPIAPSRRRATIGQPWLRATVAGNCPAQKQLKYSHFEAPNCPYLRELALRPRPSKPWVAGSSPAGGRGRSQLHGAAPYRKALQTSEILNSSLLGVMPGLLGGTRRALPASFAQEEA